LRPWRSCCFVWRFWRYADGTAFAVINREGVAGAWHPWLSPQPSRILGVYCCAELGVAALLAGVYAPVPWSSACAAISCCAHSRVLACVRLGVLALRGVPCPLRLFALSRGAVGPLVPRFGGLFPRLSACQNGSFSFSLLRIASRWLTTVYLCRVKAAIFCCSWAVAFWLRRHRLINEAAVFGLNDRETVSNPPREGIMAVTRLGRAQAARRPQLPRFLSVRVPVLSFSQAGY
jgi:hypothetical protein